MEQLLKDLRNLGFELVYYEPFEAWHVIDFLAYVNDFLPSAFSEVVFKNGFSFSCGVTLDGKGLCVKFYEL